MKAFSHARSLADTLQLPGGLQVKQSRPHHKFRILPAKIWGVLAFLWLCAGGSSLFAANLLTNPGFEDGQNGWANPNLVYGGVSVVITNPAIAHSGNNFSSNYNASGSSGPQQGDSQGAYSTGVSIPLNSANFYRLSAWVKVPGASTNAQSITLRYRFEPSASRVDVGTKSINTENWTLLQSPWLQPAPGDSFESYWIVHSVNNGIAFFADDCALDESLPLTLQGRVVDGSAVGVDNATVTATSPDFSTTSVTTSGGGYYTLNVPPGTYTIGANTPGFLGFTTNVVSVSPTTAADIVLGTDPNYDPDLIFLASASKIPSAGAAWTLTEPVGAGLTPGGTPGVISIGGQKWEVNHNASSDKYILPNTLVPPGYAINGGSIVVAVRPTRLAGTQPWYSIVDLQYDQMVLGIDNPTGRVIVKRKGVQYYSTATIPDGQVTVLSLVVNLDGTFTVWANGVQFMTSTATADMSSLGNFSLSNSAIGANAYDAWPIFNGLIGDVYVYKVALDNTKRMALETSLMNKFITNATLNFSITSSAGANGSITPLGTTNVLQGYNQSYTMTANSGYVVSDVLVDGASVGPKATYTFTNVTTNHTIAVSFVALPPQTITASAGANGTISPTGSVSVPAGNNQTFSFIPNSGYAVANVLVDGVSQGEIYSYTFNFVTAPHTVSVTFRQLTMNIPEANNLIFSVVSGALPGDNNALTNWPVYVPTNKTLTVIGSPTSTVINGATSNIWEANNNGTFDGFRFPGGSGGGGEYLAPIACNGATIVAVAAPNTTGVGNDPWTSIVDVFYNQLILGIRNNNGTVVAVVNGGAPVYGSDVIPSGQPTVLTMVVQPDGTYKVWANTALMITGSGLALTNLAPGGNTYMHYINVGRNNPDTWTSFNGNIGDVFLYKTALSDSERQQMETLLMAKFGAPLPPKANWQGPNNGNWSAATNWDNTLPSTTVNAVFSDTNTAGATVQLDTAQTVKGIQFNNLVPNTTIASTLGNTLTLDNGTGQYNTLAALQVDGGSHTISAAVDAQGGIQLTGPGKLTLSGSASIGTFSTVNPALVVNGGELALSGSSTLTFTRSAGMHGGGKLTISGAFTSSDADQKIGDDWGTGPGYLELKGTGSWTHTGTGNFIVGTAGPANTGTMTINDNAVLDLTGNGPLNISLGFNGGTTGSVIQNGGTVKTITTAQAWRTGYGPGVLLGEWANTPCNATYSLNGGILQIPSIGSVAWDGANNMVTNPASMGSTAVLNLNGGTIAATDNDATDPDAIAEGSAHLIFNTTHTWVQAGGAKINNGAFSNSVAVSLEHDASGPALDGGLTKSGAGTLMLLNPSTYTGPTKVQAGVLACAVNSALGNGSLDISTGAKVALNYTGTRSISQLTFNGGATQPNGTYGATGSGATTIDNTHFTGTGTVTVAPSAPPAPVLTAASTVFSGGVPTFTFATVSGYKYRVVYKNSLTDPVWTVVINPPNNPGPDGWGAVSTGSPATIGDPSATGQARRFYRVEVANP